jgi:hypothetical protein
MSKLLLLFLVVVSELTLVSCTTQGVALLPLTETERQGLGTIGIAAEVSKSDTLYSRDPSFIDEGLRAMQDRLNDAGQGAINGIKLALASPALGKINCDSGGPSGTRCLVSLLASLAVVPGAGVIGGVVGAIDRKTYSNPPLMELPERAVIRVVQESIDAAGLPERLRDHVWEKAQMYKTYQFERLSELPADPLKMQGEDRNRENGPRYWPLRDKGIQTILKIRIPLIEFQGPNPEDDFQLVVHVETTLLSTNDQACIRYRTWEYQGGSHRIAEWNKDGAKPLVDELDQGIPLIAQRVTQAFFEQPSLFSFGAPTPVTPKSESLACEG